uniref:Protein kinase domain-containing protein n=1 Tax=Panagrolaimus sp. ES5 TaxID=591445 RepID=A0AC34FJN2_9BILA
MLNDYTEHLNVKLEIDELEIGFVNVVGKGSNSVVHKANFKQKDTEKNAVEVAVKIPISFKKEDIDLFKLELDAYVRIGSHPHIITFYGWILHQNVPAIVLELATENLLLYVRSFHKKQQFSTSNFISILLQLSQALKHVAALNIIHRDVACRNILMITKDHVKISDFGLCCKCNENETYYAASRKKLPLKWLSIEALTQKKFSEKSDVWAFGILCYEMFSFGIEPYSTFSNVEMLEFLQSGKRLLIPKNTPESISSIMTDCWNENPNDRPTFAILEQRIMKILEGESAKYGYVTVTESAD